jgi:hypothetical protein
MGRDHGVHERQCIVGPEQLVGRIRDVQETIDLGPPGHKEHCGDPKPGHQQQEGLRQQPGRELPRALVKRD